MKFPDPVLKKLGEVSQEVIASIANKDPLTKKIYNSYEKFKKQVMPSTTISEEAYTLARSLTKK